MQARRMTCVCDNPCRTITQDMSMYSDTRTGPAELYVKIDLRFTVPMLYL